MTRAKNQRLLCSEQMASEFSSSPINLVGPFPNAGTPFQPDANSSGYALRLLRFVACTSPVVAINSIYRLVVTAIEGKAVPITSFR